jgi:hypothetical protein
MNLDVMVDLETLGTTNDSVVLSIGAVKFALDGDDTEESINMDDIEEGTDDRSFYYILPPQPTRHVDQGTMRWWNSQSTEARKVLDSEPTLPTLQEVQRDFFHFCRGTESLWGNGNMFDNAILRSLFAPAFPYKYWADLDYRTLKKLYESFGYTTYPAFKSIPHHALCDAKMQAITAQYMWRKINGTEEDAS